MDLSTLLPDATEPPDGWRWATVTQVSPVRVTLDGDDDPLLLDHDVVGGLVAVGSRVYCQRRGHRIVVFPRDVRARAVGSFTASSGWALFQGAISREWGRVVGVCRFDRLTGSVSGTTTVGTISDGFRPPFQTFGSGAVLAGGFWTPAVAIIDTFGALTISAPGLTYTAAAANFAYDQSLTA